MNPPRIRLRRKRLARALARKKLSQNGWARRIGISSSHLSMLLSGSRKYPNVETRRKLLQALDLDFEQLFFEEVPGQTLAPRVRQMTGNVLQWSREVVLQLFDLKPALRSLWRRPGLSLLLLGVLGLGMGASIAIFSVVDAVLLRPLRFLHPDRLVAVWQTYPHWQSDPILGEFWDNIPLSLPEYRDWREAQTVFDEVALVGTQPVILHTGGRPLRVKLGLASDNFFRLLGVAPRLGNDFPLDPSPESPPPALLSHSLWKSRFSSDPDILGASIRIDQQYFRVIGVLPEGFRFRQRFLRGFSNQADLWTRIEGFQPWVEDRGNRSFLGVARVRSGLEMKAVLAETVRVLRGDISAEHRGARVVPLLAEWTGEARSALLPLLVGVGLLLFISCGNAAGLLIGEGARRSDEMAIRSALGASGTRLVIQLLKESLLLGVAASALGLILAHWLLELVLLLLPSDLPRADEIGLDFRVLFFALGLGIVTALFFGAVPAAYMARRSTRTPGFLRATVRLEQIRWQKVAVCFQIGMGFVLIVGTSLLAQSWLRLSWVDPGFDARDLLAVSVDLPELPASQEPSDSTASRERSALVGRIQEALREIPGVSAVGGVSHLPLTNSTQSNSLEIEGGVTTSNDAGHIEAQRREILSGYFESSRIPTLEGRNFRPEEGLSDERTTLINQQMAERFWGGRSALGHRIRWDRQWWTVVGIVGDVLQKGLNEPPQSTFYVPYARNPRRDLTFLVRRQPGLQESMLGRIEDVIRSVESEIAVTRASEMETIVADSLAEERFRSLIGTIFAISALLLAGVGVYSVIARLVTTRFREFGIRIALGATNRDILKLVLGGAQKMTLWGVSGGILASFLLARFLTGVLFGVTPGDWKTYLLTVLLLLLLSWLASLFPAWRASRLNPARALQVD